MKAEKSCQLSAAHCQVASDAWRAWRLPHIDGFPKSVDEMPVVAWVTWVARNTASNSVAASGGG